MEQAGSHAVETVRASREGCPAGVILLAIGGLTAAGKSLLARTFQKEIQALGENARVLEGDRFILPKARRSAGERYPEDVYELDRLSRALGALKAGNVFLSPFYHKMDRTTDRLQAPARGEGDAEPRGDYKVREASALIEQHRHRTAHPASRLWIDADTGDLLEEVSPNGDVWIFDSEIALAYPGFRSCYDASYAVWASRARRRRNFLEAVRKGERYPVLSEREALEKVEGFFLEDDRFNQSFLHHAQVWVDNS